MFCLIKSENILGQFRENVYTIEYQKHDLPHIHLFIFLNSANEFLEDSHIDKVTYVEI